MDKTLVAKKYQHKIQSRSDVLLDAIPTAF